jgi:hypothetical protein
LVSSLPLWFSIPPFDIAILQQQRHNFKTFGCFRTRSTPSYIDHFMSLWPQRKSFLRTVLESEEDCNLKGPCYILVIIWIIII